MATAWLNACMRTTPDYATRCGLRQAPPGPLVLEWPVTIKASFVSGAMTESRAVYCPLESPWPIGRPNVSRTINPIQRILFFLLAVPSSPGTLKPLVPCPSTYSVLTIEKNASRTDTFGYSFHPRGLFIQAN